MAGSKCSKHSHRKESPKNNKSDTINMKAEVSQTSNIHPDVPRDLDDDIEAVLDFKLPTTTTESSHTLDEMEQLLYVKLDLLYTKAQDQLLKSGYNKTEVESAILHAGSVHGNMDILNNVCQNTIVYIEKKSEPGTKKFKDLVELYKCTLENLVDSVKTTQRTQRHGAIWHLLVKNWGFGFESGDQSSLWFRESRLGSGLRRNEDISSLHPSSAENDHMKRLVRENAQMRADIEAIKLNASEYENDFAEVLERERRFMRKVADVEKQASFFQSQFEEEKQRMAQLEIELLRAEKELVEAEMKWRQETTEKESTYALLSEEMKKLETGKANSRAQLLKFQQKVDIDSQLARDDLRRLENELSSLRISNQTLEIDSFGCEIAESSSSKEAIIRHWICMMCLQNEVSVVFLPCTHQVLCSSCYSENISCCPYCHVKIEGSIKAYGPSS